MKTRNVRLKELMAETRAHILARIASYRVDDELREELIAQATATMRPHVTPAELAMMRRGPGKSTRAAA